MNGLNDKKTQRLIMAGLLVISVVILFSRLGVYPLQMQWEPNYGQVVREMVWGEGNEITPTCKVGSDEGAAPGTFWSKPIMIFWLAYPFYAMFGDSEWSARGPIAALGVIVILFTYWFMSRLYTRRVGVLASLLLLTTPAYFLISRAYMVDLPFVGFMWMGVGFLLLGEKEGRERWYNLFFVFLGLSALAKGLTPIILTGGTVFFYCLVSGDWGLLKRMKLHKGLIIFLIVAGPWYIYMSSKYGMPYLKKFFWDHHVERSLGKLDKPDDTFEMFVLYFSIGVLPWITFLPQAVATMLPWRRREADHRRLELFFFMGFLVTFTFFSVISTKFVHYIFPAVPYTMMLIALYIDRLFTENDRGELNRVSFFAALMVLLIIAPDLIDMKNYRTLFYFITTERLQDWHPNVADPSYFFSIVFAIWGVVLFVSFVIRRFNRWIFGGLLALSIAYAFYINFQMIPTLTEMFSARSMMQTYLAMRAGPDEPIGEFTQTWKSRSIKYEMPFKELKDTYQYRRYRINNNLNSVRRYYQTYKGKRVFIIIEQKQKHFDRINALWQEVSDGEKLIKIFDDSVPGEPYRSEFWLLSNRDNFGRAVKLTPEQMMAELEQNVRRKPFDVPQKLEVDFEGEIDLMGTDAIPTKIKAGSELTLALYFKAKRKPTRDYKIFIHAERATTFRLRGDHVPVSGRYPTTRWKEGDYIKDVYKLDIPPNTAPGELEIFIGLYQGNYRARMADVPQRDGEGRLKIATVEVTL